MVSRRQRQVVALVLALMLVIPGLIALVQVAGGNSAGEQPPAGAGPTADPGCRTAPDRVAVAVQRYVDKFGTLTGFEHRRLPAPPRLHALRGQFQQVRRDLEAAGCDLTAFRTALAGSLDDVRADGPLATAVAGLLRTTALRTLGDKSAPAVSHAAPGDDLATVVARVRPGGTLRLSAGEYRIGEPVYLLQDVRVVGAGRGRTRIVSTAAGAGMLVPLPAHVRLERLALAHAGPKPASALVVWAGRARLSSVRLSGASGGPTPGAGSGDSPTALTGGVGSGVLVSQAAVLVLRDAQLDDNDVAGVVAGGRARVDVRASAFRGNGLCGLCFTGRSAGVVQGSEVTGGAVGVYVGQRSSPTLRHNAVSGTSEAGIAVQEQAKPVLTGNRLGGNSGVGIGVYAASRPRVDGNTVAGSGRAGLVVDTTAAARAEVSRNRFSGNRAGDVVVAGEGRVVLRANTCGSTYQVVLVDDARADLAGNACTSRRQQRS